MKKLLSLTLLLCLLFGCAQPEEEGVLVIREKLFVQQTNDVYYNIQDYMGMPVRYEGIFQSHENQYTGETEYYVIRYGPGCCGIDADAGFEVTWQQAAWPKEDAWVQVEGIIDGYSYGRQTFPIVQITTLTVLDKRGREYVTE